MPLHPFVRLFTVHCHSDIEHMGSARTMDGVNARQWRVWSSEHVERAGVSTCVCARATRGEARCVARRGARRIRRPHTSRVRCTSGGGRHLSRSSGRPIASRTRAERPSERAASEWSGAARRPPRGHCDARHRLLTWRERWSVRSTLERRLREASRSVKAETSRALHVLSKHADRHSTTLLECSVAPTESHAYMGCSRLGCQRRTHSVRTTH